MPLPPINGSLNDFVDVYEGENVTFKCNSGFYPQQLMYAMCLPTGVWSIDPGRVVCRPEPICGCSNARRG